MTTDLTMANLIDRVIGAILGESLQVTVNFSANLGVPTASWKSETTMNLRERTYLWYIALLRIFIGYYLLQQGIRKFLGNFPKGDWIGRQIGDVATLDISSWYKHFL
ncbi:MAG TPA: hypothetical protein VE689_01535, partial [Candidatus Udaeobacter sp.]|nr:hypothetical protein [Candidatus Udaeobacter sp.]